MSSHLFRSAIARFRFSVPRRSIARRGRSAIGTLATVVIATGAVGIGMYRSNATQANAEAMSEQLGELRETLRDASVAADGTPRTITYSVETTSIYDGDVGLIDIHTRKLMKDEVALHNAHVERMSHIEIESILAGDRMWTDEGRQTSRADVALLQTMFNEHFAEYEELMKTTIARAESTPFSRAEATEIRSALALAANRELQQIRLDVEKEQELLLIILDAIDFFDTLEPGNDWLYNPKVGEFVFSDDADVERFNAFMTKMVQLETARARARSIAERNGF